MTKPLKRENINNYLRVICVLVYLNGIQNNILYVNKLVLEIN